jgi:hypothetical protein
MESDENLSPPFRLTKFSTKLRRSAEYILGKRSLPRKEGLLELVEIHIKHSLIHLPRRMFKIKLVLKRRRFCF